MSSVTTRTEIKNFFTTNSAETLIDLSGEFRSLSDVMKANSIGVNDEWVGIEFLGSSEEYISVTTSCYREFGSIFFSVVAPIKLGGVDAILTRCETIRSLYRGVRINDIVITEVGPPNTERGTTLEFDNGFTSAAFFVDYYRDI